MPPLIVVVILVVVAEVLPEEWERLGERATAGHDLGPAAESADRGAAVVSKVAAFRARLRSLREAEATVVDERRGVVDHAD